MMSEAYVRVPQKGGRDGPQSTFNDTEDHPLVNSVTNDEDDLPCDYRDNFSNTSVGTSHYQHHHSNMIRKSNEKTTIEYTSSSAPGRPSASNFGGPPPISSSDQDYFDRDSYLICYERMMMKQEMEQISTVSHVQSLLGLLEDLLLEGQTTNNNGDNNLLKEVFLEDLKLAHDKIKHSNEFEIIKTDKQFMMVLGILCEEKDYSSAAIEEKQKRNGGNRISKRNNELKKISWAEIIQCYRICVVGMQTLEIIGSESTIRKRAKERTLAILSLYLQSSFSNSSSPVVRESPTATACDEAPSKMKYGDSAIKSVGVENGNQPDNRPRGLFIRPIVSFLIGAMVAGILFCTFSSNTELMTQYDNITLTNPTQGVECPREANESFSHTVREFQSYENTIDVAPPEKSVFLTKNGSVEHIPANEAKITSTKKSLPTTTSRVVSPISRARIGNSIAISPSFDQKFDSEFDNEDDDDDGTKNQRLTDLELANAIGGTATIIYFFSSFVTGNMITAAAGLIPMGLTVSITTIIVNSIQDWFSRRKNREKTARKRKKIARRSSVRT
ncbi:MAG: hypothetical protein ACI8RD_012961 [Bacillariaceae sp.]|jgi:hypothetical protein